MYKKAAKEFYKELESKLTDRAFLIEIGMSKRAMTSLLEKERWQDQIAKILEQGTFSCASVLTVCKKVLDRLAEEPKEGWLQYLYEDTIGILFPEKVTEFKYKGSRAGKVFYLTVLRQFLQYEREHMFFAPLLHIKRLSEYEIRQCNTKDEYLRFLDICDRHSLYAFMRIGMEVTPYNLLNHIAGVHFVAQHVGKQLYRAGEPVDIALVSCAAACHDVGKFGCRESEERRIPYLHYYYTDQCLKRFDLPTAGHIASNHSTWDLELENLSVESLLLIYADFRVRGDRNRQGIDDVAIYTLDEAFEIILSKLDDVDDAKKQRYSRVYSKLKDFEDYMISLGVNVGLDSDVLRPVPKKDPAIMNPAEVVNRLKELAIEHNINVMNIFNSEAEFGKLLEEARSEFQWKNIRAYINIFEEYSTYMTQKQKMMTLHFLYEMLMHREGDIRRQAAGLMGKMIAQYDEEYRKELPKDVILPDGGVRSDDMWRKYLYMILFPDHKVPEQHKRWIGYAFRFLLATLFSSCKPGEKKMYTTDLLMYYKDMLIDDATAFILLDSMPFISLDYCSEEEQNRLMDFATELAKKDLIEIKVGVLRFAEYLANNKELVSSPKADTFIQKITNELSQIVRFKRDSISEIFLENLKVGTPWIVKVVNIGFLLEISKSGDKSELLHIATHLSNLIKVSERVIVRHTAGEGLVEIIRLLPLDERNEVAIELTKGLEIGEYQVSKYIPQYLGELALFLHPNELDEFIRDLKKLQESSNDRVSSVTLNTLGIMIQKYSDYQGRFEESKEAYEARRSLVLGMILRGLANYRDVVSQEALLVIGMLFASKQLSQMEKYVIFENVYKKMLTLISDRKETKLSSFNNAAALNHIYRYISDYLLDHGEFAFERKRKIAYFPGTFDPFSLSHKGIALATRDLGFEVYLALDEFSWSKKTQPRMIRRQIMTMSVADEKDIYVFPDEIPVNISNSDDLKQLRDIWPEVDLYITVGSDVIANASSYKNEQSENSIHHLNHIVFDRMSESLGSRSVTDFAALCKNIIGDVLRLKLPMHLEDISSTRIRENIDLNRDISNLIDPIIQNYIYDNSLYLREPIYKLVMQSKDIKISIEKGVSPYIINEILTGMLKPDESKETVRETLSQKNISCMTIRDGSHQNKLAACCTYKEVKASDTYSVFRHLDLAAHIREHASGKIVMITGIYFDVRTSIREPIQMVLTEVLAECLENDFTYAVYKSMDSRKVHAEIAGTLERQGFERLNFPGNSKAIYAVDMKFPICLLKNMGANLKDPFNRNEKILSVIDRTHKKLQRAMIELYPGNLVLSLDSDMLHRKLVKMIARENNVPLEPFKERRVGPYMCVPFGAMLRGIAVPNTVTKTLHTEKVFHSDIINFRIKEFPFYSTIINQARTIKSFGRPVILVDDFLHKGYRMQELDPVLKQEEIEVSKIIVGILSGRGKDLMEIQKRQVECAYFVPNLRFWFVESVLYPFIGGDSVAKENVVTAGIIPSINLILPYVAPRFLADAQKQSLYDMSMVCLENTRDILKALEEEYQTIYERTLTLNRLSEAIIAPRTPDRGDCVHYDFNLPPSVYVSNDIEMLLRLDKIFES